MMMSTIQVVIVLALNVFAPLPSEAEHHQKVTGSVVARSAPSPDCAERETWTQDVGCDCLDSYILRVDHGSSEIAAEYVIIRFDRRPVPIPEIEELRDTSIFANLIRDPACDRRVTFEPVGHACAAGPANYIETGETVELESEYIDLYDWLPLSETSKLPAEGALLESYVVVSLAKATGP